MQLYCSNLVGRTRSAGFGWSYHGLSSHSLATCGYLEDIDGTGALSRISWWWRGVPRNLGNAVVLGPPYLDLWPKFASAAERVGDLAMIDSPDWSVKFDIASKIGGVPEDIAMVGAEGNSRTRMTAADLIKLARQPIVYPKSWPFQSTDGETG